MKKRYEEILCKNGKFTPKGMVIGVNGKITVTLAEGYSCYE